MDELGGPVTCAVLPGASGAETLIAVGGAESVRVCDAAHTRAICWPTPLSATEVIPHVISFLDGAAAHIEVAHDAAAPTEVDLVSLPEILDCDTIAWLSVRSEGRLLIWSSTWLEAPSDALRDTYASIRVSFAVFDSYFLADLLPGTAASPLVEALDDVCAVAEAAVRDARRAAAS